MSMIDKLFTQIIGLLGNEANQKKLHVKIIDPLVTYFKYKLRYFFVVIIFLLCCILLTNIFMVGYFLNLKNILSSITELHT